MNNYHRTHPDPDIRQKYLEWSQAMMRAGKLTREEKKELREKEKTAEGKNNKFMSALRSLCGNAGFRAQSARKQKIRKTGGQRGS